MTVVIFLFIHLIPGDPAIIMIGRTPRLLGDGLRDASDPRLRSD